MSTGQHRIARVLRRVAGALAMVLGVLGGTATAPAWIATGQFNYTDRTYDLAGFTGTLVGS